MENKTKKIVAFGNPLLDTVVLIQDDVLLKKYKLRPDGQKEVSRETMQLLRRDIKNYETTVSPGGCAQNTLKMIQWLLDKKFSATIFGAIGDDEEGKILTELLNQQGVDTNYIVHKDYPTGTTVALTGGQSRSLVAYLGAAKIVSQSDLNSEILSHLEEADLIYIEGFFLTKRKEVTSFILQYCNSHNKLLAFNLSGKYMCKEYSKQIIKFSESSDMIFGNRLEFVHLTLLVREASVERLVNKLRKKGKTIVVTDGDNFVLAANKDTFFKASVPVLKEEEIVDTTGAGDAFVAGFLAGYLSEKSLKICVKMGCYAAQEIIKRKGCTVPEYPPTIPQ